MVVQRLEKELQNNAACRKPLHNTRSWCRNASAVFNFRQHLETAKTPSQLLFPTQSSAPYKPSPVTIFKASPISLCRAPTYNCHQLALCINVPLCGIATMQHKDAVTRRCIAHLRDKVKQIAPLFYAAAPVQIGFK